MALLDFCLDFVKRLINRFAPLVLALCAAPSVYGIGDSGGCIASPLESAVKTGTPADVERELKQWLEIQSQSRSLVAKLSRAIEGVSEKQRIAKLIEGVHEEGEICRPRALLPLAIRHGNVEVVRLLLGRPLDVKPRIPPHILFVHSLCSHESRLDEGQRARRREAHALLLESGEVDVNARSGFGQTILQTCFEPELVSLFIERGARTDVEWGQGIDRLNLIEQAMLEALVVSADGVLADRRHGVARVKLFSSFMSNSTRGRPVEQKLRTKCAFVVSGKRHYAEACRVLSGLVDATPGTFGD